MAERLFQAKEKVGEALRSRREKVQALREPLAASSVEEFMGLVDTREGVLVELFPGYTKEGYYYRRKRRAEEYGGFLPDWVIVYRHTGYMFLTDWQSHALSNRRVGLRQEHETLDKNVVGYDVILGHGSRPTDYEGARERWFKEAVATAEAQHQQFPQMRFVVQGVDGLQDYSYYQDEQFSRRRAWVR